MLLDAVRTCVSTNVMRPVHTVLEPILGDLSTAFDESIIYRAIGMSGGVELFNGSSPIRQMIGRILHNSDIIAKFSGDSNNCLVNDHSLINTNVYVFQLENVVKVVHVMPYNEVALRYLSRTRAHTHIEAGDNIQVTLSIPFEVDNMSAVMDLTRELESILTIYYILLTRFPSCQSSLTALPGFRT